MGQLHKSPGGGQSVSCLISSTIILYHLLSFGDPFYNLVY